MSEFVKRQWLKVLDYLVENRIYRRLVNEQLKPSVATNGEEKPMELKTTEHYIMTTICSS